MSTIPIPEMNALITAGSAQPLLPEGVPGPVIHAGQWWSVAHGATDYSPITDPATTSVLNNHARRLHGAATTLAHPAGGDRS